MKIKVMKNKKSKIVDAGRGLEDIRYTCRKYRIRGYTIIKFIR